MSEPTKTAKSVRERLLKAVDELFYAEGMHTVGIERAGVAKASLYVAPLLRLESRTAKALCNDAKASPQDGFVQKSINYGATP